MLSAVVANNFAQVSTLQTSKWEPTFGATLSANTTASLALFSKARYWLATKAAAGFPVSIVDALGLEILTSFADQTDAAAGRTYSDLANLSSLQTFQMPLPIIMSNGVDTAAQCVPDGTAPNYETTPYEFGSWDAGVAAFTPTKYLGMSDTNMGQALPWLMACRLKC